MYRSYIGVRPELDRSWTRVGPEKKITASVAPYRKNCIFARSFEKGKLAERLKAAVSKTARVKSPHRFESCTFRHTKNAQALMRLGVFVTQLNPRYFSISYLLRKMSLLPMPDA